MAGLVSGGAPASWGLEGARGGTVTARFARCVSSAPSAIAIMPGRAGAVTYAELDGRSNQLARLLMASGVGPGQVVALLSGRSADSLVAILAILKAGAAYAPIDPSFPPHLLQWTVQDCGARVTLAAGRHVDGLAGQAVALEDMLAIAASESDATLETDIAPADLAYVMYTSGSTGRPKGAAIPHRAVVRLVSEQTYAHFGPDEVFLHAAPLAFDASTFEIWGALLHGGRIAIVGEDLPPLQQIADIVVANGVTTAWFTAGLFNLLVEAKLPALAGLRQILAGGDVLSPTHVQRALDALPHCQLINGYGPTENTTFTCCYPIPRDGWGGGPVPIGVPIRDTYIRVLDSELNPVAEGEVGALYAGGAGLAAGYIGAAAPTSVERFLPDPLAPGAILYDTGDLVRRRSDGALEFVGRSDRQLKIDGKRVEPGEVEEALRCCDGVADALVIASKSAASTALVGYLKSSAAVEEREGLVSNVRAALAAKLPAYMRPSQLIALTSFPLTPNGKVDHARLPAPQSSDAPSPAAAEGLERQLSDVFRRVLGVQDVSPDANFFDLGATSLKLIAAHASIEELVNGVDVLALFEHANIRDLARHLRNRTEATASDALQDRAQLQREALRRARHARSSQ